MYVSLFYIRPDAIMAIALFQTPGADDKVADTIINYSIRREKPIVAVSIGSSYTKAHTAVMENSGVPVYDSTTAAARSLAALVEYAKYRARKDARVHTARRILQQPSKPCQLHTIFSNNIGKFHKIYK